MSINPEKWLEIVRGLAEQNSAVRVCLLATPMEEGGLCTRVRVLGLGDDNVTIVEEPGVKDLGQRLQEGTEVEVLVVGGGKRLLGLCHVKDQMRYALNKSTQIAAVSLFAPFKVISGQMRDYYRAPVGAGVDTGPVELRFDQNDGPTIMSAVSAKVDTKATYKARLVNISGGGMGLAMTVAPAMVSVLHIGTAFQIKADMPTMDEPLDLTGNVVHIHKMNNDELYLGLAFVFNDTTHQQQVEDQLQHLSAWLQRRLLKNER